MKHIQSLIFSVILSCLFGTSYAEATAYTVKAGGGGNYTTISACTSAASAGDTCTIFAGSYSGWTQGASGSAGSPITFTANTGDTVTITSGINISSRSYITISYLTINGQITGNGSTSHNLIDHNKFNTATAFRIDDGQGNGGSDNVISNNVVDRTGATSTTAAFYVYGDRNRFEDNEIKYGQADCFGLGGTNTVVRRNYCHDISGASGEHIDFIQQMGDGTAPTINYSLVEGNVEDHCYNDGGNCHALILRSTNPTVTGVIYRYNYAHNLDGGGITNGGGTGDTAAHTSIYNNTLALEEFTAENGDFVSCWAKSGGTNGVIVANNISYNTGGNGWSPFSCDTGTNGALLLKSNLAFNVGYSGDWGSPYNTETTYAALHSKDPKFANYPTNGTLLPTSPAIGAGSYLTTVAAGDSGSGTSLVVNNAYPFQPGWAGTNADWIRIGTTTTVQITSVNYATNTITLASSIGRSPGNPVYLYKNSNGQIVLFGNAPDVGAYPYFAPATNLGAVAH